MKPQKNDYEAGEAEQAAGKKSSCTEAVDDGRTIAPMDAEWMPWNAGTGVFGRHSRAGRKQKKAPSDDVSLTPSEKRAVVRGAFLAHLPVIVGMAVVGALLYLLARLWLMPG